MGRKPKVANILESNPQEVLVCSVCGKEFKRSGDTKYTINHGYTCSWKCFYNEVKRREAEKNKDNKTSENKKKKK